jgi:hypothetical protein
MTSTEGPVAALSLRRSPNPWSGATGIAVVFTALMAAGLVAAVVTGHRGVALAPAALIAVGIGLSIYTNTRRSRPEMLVITGDALEHVGQADRGFALARPRSRVYWADVSGIAVVTWHKRPWIGVRTRAGAHLTGPIWVQFRELDLMVMTSADSWGVPRDELVRHLRLAAERSGVVWLGELTAAER